MSSNRADLLVRDILRRMHEAIVEHDVTYEEYQAAKQWLIDVGNAGEWPLFLDVFVETVVERNAHRGSAGSTGTILGPYYLPDAPVLAAPYELPRREDELGEPLLIVGRVLAADGSPISAAEVDVWQADAAGYYSGFEPSLPEGILRGKVFTDEAGNFELRTVLPGPYTIPLNGPTGALCAAAGWSPWRPAHIHMILRAAGHEDLITQIFFQDTEYLASDVAGAVKDDLIVSPQRQDDGSYSFDYEFRLAPSAVGATA
ncbi:MAG: dioxygenase family protein [Solirubrobacteraceae bacterium]